MTGFETFSAGHLIWLAICTLIAAAELVILKKTAEDRSSAFFRVSACAVFILHILESLYRIYEGSFDIGTLPLHLCAIAAYLIPVHTVFPCRFLSAALFCPCLPGSIAAILFPDWTAYPPFSPLSILGFLSHTAIAAHIAALIAGGRYKPSFRDLPLSAVFLALYAAVILPFDMRFGTNYGFMLYPVGGTPLTLLAEIGGNGAGYRIAYMVFISIIAAAWYMIWIGTARIISIRKY